MDRRNALKSLLGHARKMAPTFLLGLALLAGWTTPVTGQSSGTWPPSLASHARYAPHVLSAGKSYRVWYLIQNTAPESRRYVIVPWPVTEIFQFNPQTYEYTLASGESRWIPIQVTVGTAAADNTSYSFHVTAYDFSGDQYGRTTDTYQVRIANALPVVTVVGGEHHTVAVGQQHRIRLWLYNPRLEARAVCFRWLEDEGPQWGVMPQPAEGPALTPGQALCENLPPREGVETEFVYTYDSPGLRRQTFQAWTTAEGNQPVHAFLKTTAVATPPARNRFYAWTPAIKPSHGIPLQSFQLDTGQDRQLVGWTGCDPSQSPAPTWNRTGVLDFARNHPGSSYIFLDEPAQRDGACDSVSPQQYAIAYHDFTMTLRGVDPSARLSPAGFEQPEGGKPNQLHFTDYAASFLNEYRNLFGVNPPVWEWRFHAFAYDPDDPSDPYDSHDLDKWRGWVNQAASWASTNSILRRPMVLGSFGFPATPDQTPAVQHSMVQMMNHIKSIPSIVGAVWWNYDYRWQYWQLYGTPSQFLIWCDEDKVVNGVLYRGQGCRHNLADPATNALQPEGTTYVNNLP